MPVELKLLIWLPAIPVKTRSILQSAISSASSRVRWIAFTVDSMFTTTPFFRPLDSCPPMPTMSMRPSGKNSATIATTLEVPMSRATMRFLFSLAMSDSLVLRFEGLGPGRLDDPERESVGVAQVDVIEVLPRLGQRSRERRRETREALLDSVPVGVTPELYRQPVRELELPGHSRREEHLPGLEAERNEQVPEHEIAARDLALGSRRTGEDGERSAALSAEQLALHVDQLRLFPLAPARQRDLLLDAHFEIVGPPAPQLRAADPGNALEQGPHGLQIHREKRAPEASLKGVDDFAALDALEASLDDNRPEQEGRRFEQDASAGVREKT